MSDYTHQDRTLALIGIYQASQLVFDLATTGKADNTAYNTCIQSLFCSNPENTLDVYGGEVQHIKVGLNTLLAQMSSDTAIQVRNVEITRYVLSLIILQKKLQQLGEPLENIAQVLETAKNQQTHFGQNHENVIAGIARAYSENVSPVNPRIMVNGQHGHLDNPRVANKIRALLLAGIRSALLWDQLGGSRWGLLWYRKKYLQSALALQASLPDDSDNTSGKPPKDKNPPISIFKQD